MPNDLRTWQQLLSPAYAPLRDAAAACDPAAAADIARLRRLGDAALCHAALALASARRKAQTKFPGRAESLVADPAGVEQASSLRVARHKAQRYLQAGCRSVADLCCGIGGDTMGFADAGLDVLGVDRDPTRAWMARHNADRPTATADITTQAWNGRAIHLDPARRNGRGRVFRLADHQPAPPVIRSLLERCPDAGIKLGPGVDLDDLAESLPHTASNELEFISEQGRLVQAVLWTGRLARHPSTATLLSEDRTHAQTHQLTGRRGDPPHGGLRRFIHTVDPAAERAGLLGVIAERHQLAAPHPRLGLLTGDRPVASPWLTAFEVLEQMPWRPKRVKRWLHARDAGIVEVKTRGKAVDPDTAQKQLRCGGATIYTVFVLRWDAQVTALVTSRKCRKAGKQESRK